MGLKHQQAGESAHPVDVGKARFGTGGRGHAFGEGQYTADESRWRSCLAGSARWNSGFRLRVVKSHVV